MIKIKHVYITKESANDKFTYHLFIALINKWSRQQSKSTVIDN